MASYNLNEVLKKKNAEKKQQSNNQEIHLDDVSRVKVLSPGRQVLKRFARNRLAVFGTILLLAMFVFSFIGPIFYPYGQKQIFYKYDAMNVDYAQAKDNTTYNGYVFDDSVEIATHAKNNMNSSIKVMQANDLSDYLFRSGDEFYKITKLGDNIYTLGSVDTQKVCEFGDTSTFIGTYSMLEKSMSYAGEALGDAFEAELGPASRSKEATFELDGVTYTLEKSSKGTKTFDVYAQASDAFQFTGEDLGEGFKAEAEKAVEGDSTFSYNGKDYVVHTEDTLSTGYELGEAHDAIVYTCYTLDMYENGAKASDSFRTNALLAAYSTGEFEADGAKYTVVHEDDGALIVYDANGAEYADFTTFVIRRYNGDDTMEYGLKNALRGAIEEMTSRGEHETTLTYALPQQNEAGEYSYDENGALQYNETEMKITQKDTGDYLINCDQIIYQIDMYASPSWSHILGTDGDGFDVMSRIMYGGRISLMVGFVVVFLEIFLGIIMGGLAGYYGGWVDNLIMRLVDIFYCLPSMPIMIILGAMMDALRMNTYVRLMIMMAALGIMGWAGVARMVRGQILSLREQEFMVATEATGIRVKDRIFRHLVPNVMPQLIVIATMGMGSVILTESTLSYLGLGVKHPLATWGTIINSVSSASAMAHYAFIWIPVGLLICLTVIAFNFVGDGLRDAYDPKSKR